MSQVAQGWEQEGSPSAPLELPTQLLNKHGHAKPLFARVRHSLSPQAATFSFAL